MQGKSAVCSTASTSGTWGQGCVVGRQRGGCEGVGCERRVAAQLQHAARGGCGSVDRLTVWSRATALLTLHPPTWPGKRRSVSMIASSA